MSKRHRCHAGPEPACPFSHQAIRAAELMQVGSLARGVMHDMNNLLSVILANAQYMLSDHGAFEEKSSDRLRTIKATAECAASLCHDMLAVANGGKAVSQAVDVGPLLTGMSMLLRSCVKRSVKLDYRLAPDLPCVLGNPNHIRQIVLNLVKNADDAIGRDGQGQIVITVDSGIPTPTSSGASDIHSGRYVLIRVSDDGCGMDTALQDQIFEPFYSTKGNGRGLGLAEVNDLVKGMQGYITIDSARGKGTVITVGFPVKNMEGSRSSEAEGREGKTSERIIPLDGSGLVLLADDEPHLLQVTATLLDQLGYDVLVASNGKEAVTRFREHRDSICAVLLDAEMPEMSGVEAFWKIRSIDARVPVLMISGHPEVDLASSFSGNCPDMVLLKPVAADSLNTSLARVLSGAGCDSNE